MYIYTPYIWLFLGFSVWWNGTRLALIIFFPLYYFLVIEFWSFENFLTPAKPGSTQTSIHLPSAFHNLPSASRIIPPNRPAVTSIFQIWLWFRKQHSPHKPLTRVSIQKNLLFSPFCTYPALCRWSKRRLCNIQEWGLPIPVELYFQSLLMFIFIGQMLPSAIHNVPWIPPQQI